MKKLNCIGWLAVWIVCMSISTGTRGADVTGYTFSQSSGAYTALSSPTTIHAAGVDDAMSSAIPIGFTFNYCGTGYTDFYASSNGFISFANVASGATNDLSSSSYTPCVAGFWDDLKVDGTGLVSYKPNGSSPNRTMTIEYKNMNWYYNDANLISFQIILYETSNKIDIVYGTMGNSPGGSQSASIGINDFVGSTVHANWIVGSTPANPATNATGSPGSPNNVITSVANIPGGKTYTFTPAGATPSVTLADNGTQVTAANVAQGTTAHILHKSQLTVTTANATLTGMTCTTTGTCANTTDITNLKVRYSTDATLDAGDATLSTITPADPTAALTFTSFTSQVINSGTTGYIFITADVGASAVIGRTIAVSALATTDFTFSAGTKSGSTTAGGTQTIIAGGLAGENCTNAQDLAGLTSPYAAATTGYADDIGVCRTGYPDRIFYISVPNGYTIDIWQSINDFDSYHYMGYGGSCPGTFPLFCVDDQDDQHNSWLNSTGSTQTVWFIVDGYNGSGNFTLNWTLTAPAVPDITLANNGTQITAANIAQGTTAHILHKSQLTVTTANATLTGMTCTTTGTCANTTDITNLKVRYSTDATLDAGDATLSTISPADPTAALTFTSFTSQVINSGTTGYIFITADVGASAVVSRTIAVSALATTDFTFSAGTKSGSTNAGGTQTITAAGPSNNECANAITLTVGSSCSYTTYDNTGATNSVSVPAPGCANFSGKDVWFKATVPASGHIIIDSDDIGLTDCGMAIYSGACGGLTLIECDDDDSPNGSMPMIEKTGLTPGATIYILFWEYGGDAFGTYGICAYDDYPAITLASANPAVTAANLTKGSTKNPIYKFTLAVTAANATLNQVVYTTAGGTYVAADITKFQLWYNTSDIFGTAGQIGSDITTSLGNGAHTFGSLSQVINSGTTGYLWVTTDVASGATTNNTIIVSAITNGNLTFASGTSTGTAYAGGTQTIVAVAPGTTGAFYHSDGANVTRVRAVDQYSDGQYAMAGYNSSMSNALAYKTDALGNVSSLYKEFGNCLNGGYGGNCGGTNPCNGVADESYCVDVIAGDNIIVGSSTNSFNCGEDDFWLMKLNTTGVRQWSKVYRYNNANCYHDEIYSMHETSDGNIITSGSYYGACYGGAPASEVARMALLKVDPSTGALLWSKGYYYYIGVGQYYDNRASYVIQTSDLGYIMTGWSQNLEGDGVDPEPRHYRLSLEVVKVTSAGVRTWDYAYFFFENDDNLGYCIQQTTDGGYIISGCFHSNTTGYDYIGVLKIDADGAVQWAKYYGFAGASISLQTRGVSLIQTSDGNYVLTGYFGIADNFHMLVMKIQGGTAKVPAGEVLWAKKMDATGNTIPLGLMQNSAGRIVICGSVDNRAFFQQINTDGSMIDPGCPWTDITINKTDIASVTRTDINLTEVTGVVVAADFVPNTDAAVILTKNDICGGTLPFDLLSFNAICNNTTVNLFWTTASEINNDYFSIERSRDATIWKTIDNVKAAGYSNSLLNYSASDNDPHESVIYYRLKQTDFNGKFSYSDVVPVNCSIACGQNIVSLNIYPNPAAEEENICYSFCCAQPEKKVHIVVRDVFGKELYSKFLFTDPAGCVLEAIDTDNRIPPGIYLITGTSDDRVYCKKLIIQKGNFF